jgi:hypothetical protein
LSTKERAKQIQLPKYEVKLEKAADMVRDIPESETETSLQEEESFEAIKEVPTPDHKTCPKYQRLTR